MLFDARSIPGKQVIESDVCIIGGGPAGITLAREFIGQPFRVCLLESGGFEFDSDTQLLYRGENVGIPYFPLEAARLRFFGGSTNHWGGWCWPLAEIDFQTREWVPHSGWPFDRAHLDPYYARAQTICQLGPYNYETKFWEENGMRPLPFLDSRIRTEIIQPHGLRFGSAYRAELIGAKNVNVLLNANALEIETTYNASTATKIPVACLSGNRFVVAAKIFILATGGIENPRLLLLSNKIRNAGLGNQNDLVGRFFMDHPLFGSGLLLPSTPYIEAGLYSGGTHAIRKTKYRGALTLSEDVQREERLLNYSCNLVSKRDTMLSDSPGMNALREFYEAGRRWQLPNDFWENLKNVISDVDTIGRAAYRKLIDGKPLIKVNMFELWHHIEQSPNPDSRLTLSRTERDRLGKNRVRLDWRLGDMERRTIRRAQEILGQEAGRAGLGRVQISFDLKSKPWTPPKEPSSWSGPVGSYHHCGTTRMHVNPKQGVVDENCRVHGMANLFVAGSSVFPTIGYANPTLTIVALAVRLADHVKKLLSR
jgi:choline dehydrogenase-like flavoprotein